MGTDDGLICRICLITDVKMYSLEKDPYKIFTATIGVLHSDPRINIKHVCYECAAILVKFSKLVKKSLKAQSALSRILDLYQQVTDNTVKSINRHDLNLNSTLIQHHINPNSTIKVEYTDKNPYNEEFAETEVKDEEKIINDNDNDSSDYVDNSTVVFVETADIKVEPDICNEEVFVGIPIHKEPVNLKSKTSKKARKKAVSKVKYRKINAESKKAKLKTDSTLSKKRRPKSMDVQILKCFDIVTLTHEEQVSELHRRKESALYASAPYKCEICFKCYQNPESFNNHMVEHSIQHGGHECIVCKKRFKLRHIYLRHLGGHQRQYRCKLCDYVCKQRQAHNHMNTHDGFKVTFKCKHCSFVTDRESVYLSHRRSHRGAASCARCGRGFITERGLALHRSRGHCTQEDSNTIEEHPCIECDIVFTTEKALKVHLSTSKKHSDKDNKSNICRKCVDLQVFSSREELTNHYTQAHPKQPVFPKQCNYCDAMFSNGKQEWSHIRSAHPNRKSEYIPRSTRLLCELCGRGFKSISELQAHSLTHLEPPLARSHAHRRKSHVDERTYVCELCTRCFKLKTNLTRHMVVHTGARPHACPQCDKRFTQPGSRDLHLRTVHYRHPHPPRQRHPRPALRTTQATSNIVTETDNL